MHGGVSEFYMMDKLKDREHSFDNGTNFGSVQTNPLVTNHFPLGVDWFSEDLTVVQSGGDLHKQTFGPLHINFSEICKFVLRSGDCNILRDGKEAKNAKQNSCVVFGCCGQDWTDEHVAGVAAPSPTYGFGVFESVEDEDLRCLLRQMIADVLDKMQQLEDHVERERLHNGLSFNNPMQFEQFAKELQKKIGARLF